MLGQKSIRSEQAYKSKQQLADEWARDPIAAIKRYLVPALLSEDEWADLETRAEYDVQAALAAARPWTAEVSTRATALRAAADAYEANRVELYALLAREAGNI